uniref:Uncharacterized protein n=1 Tax=Manihot esculenta TaxID=3983 RepID=A0A2C9V839_MANES
MTLISPWCPFYLYLSVSSPLFQICGFPRTFSSIMDFITVPRFSFPFCLSFSYLQKQKCLVEAVRMKLITMKGFLVLHATHHGKN